MLSLEIQQEPCAAYQWFLDIFESATTEPMAMLGAEEAHIAKVTSEETILWHYTDFDEYDETVLKEYGYTACSRIPRAILRLLQDRCESSPVVILDVGCGTGLGANTFRENGCRVFGFDMSPDMVRLAAAKGLYETLSVHNVEKTWPEFANVKFSAVVLLGVMEFVRNPSHVFREANLKLQVGGLFGIVIPKPCPLSEQEILQIRTHNVENCKVLLAEFGFEQVYHEEFLGYRCAVGDRDINVQYDGSVWKKIIDLDGRVSEV